MSRKDFQHLSDFSFKIWSKYTFPDVGKDLGTVPKATLAYFNWVDNNRTIRNSIIGMDQFALKSGSEQIAHYEYRCKAYYAKLFARLAQQSRQHPVGIAKCFLVIHMPSYRRIPHARLNVLLERSFLQKQLTSSVENMQMNHGV